MTKNTKTDLWNGALIPAQIWHGRRGDAKRDFRYRATYLALPLSQMGTGGEVIPVNRAGIWSLRSGDYGVRDGRSPQDFIDGLLTNVGLAEANDVTLVTLSRSLGYGFNPVSFWLCRDPGGALRAVLAEVSNTFGERHHYLCHRPDLGPITPENRLTGEKLFHVSPFLPRSGMYLFRFDTGPGRFGARVDWQAEDGTVKLGTSMSGPALPLTKSSLRSAALRHPLQSQKVIALIHLQAFRLFFRGIRYLRKPPQLPRRLSAADRHDDQRD